MATKSKLKEYMYRYVLGYGWYLLGVKCGFLL